MRVDTLGTGEVAFILRRALGPIRSNWSDFLADCSRDKTSFFGLQLLPVATVKMPGDRCKRPRYAKGDVLEFVIQALAFISRPTDTKALSTAEIELDAAGMTLPWRMRRAIPVAATSSPA